MKTRFGTMNLSRCVPCRGERPPHSGNGGVQRALSVPTRRLPSQVDGTTTFALMEAANFMNIQALLDLLIKNVAKDMALELKAAKAAKAAAALK